MCGVVWRDYGASVTGGDMKPGSGRMGLRIRGHDRRPRCRHREKVQRRNRGRPSRHHQDVATRPGLSKIPDLIRTKINLLPKQIKEVRTVELEGLDLQADGGTHTASTGEVGLMRVVDYRSKGAINKRIYVEIG